MAKKPGKNEQSSPSAQNKRGSKGQLVTYFIIFVFGFLSGIAFTVYKGEIPGPVSAPPTGGNSQSNTETAQAILNLEAEVTANPENFQNWVRLGHLYYDTNQPEKAIGAYTKALELHSGDANLLTDLGVMYRRAKQPEKAIEQFDLAIKKDPNHVPARFNKGIVLMYDLGDPEGAMASWEEVLKIDPQAKTSSGESISDLLKQIKEGKKKTD